MELVRSICLNNISNLESNNIYRMGVIKVANIITEINSTLNKTSVCEIV